MVDSFCGVFEDCSRTQALRYLQGVNWDVNLAATHFILDNGASAENSEECPEDIGDGDGDGKEKAPLRGGRRKGKAVQDPIE